MKNPGNVIPSLPEKNLLTKLDLESQEFMDERKKWLEYFLNSLLGHRYLVQSGDVEAFLKFDEKEFYVYKGENTAGDEDAESGIQEKFWDTWASVKNKIWESDVNYIDNTIMGNALAPYENFCNQLENVIRTFIGVFTESIDSEQDKISIESDLLSERLWVLEKKAHTSGIDPKIVPKDKNRFSGLQIYNKTLLE